MKLWVWGVFVPIGKVSHPTRFLAKFFTAILPFAIMALAFAQSRTVNPAPAPTPKADSSQDAAADMRFHSRATLIQVPVIVIGKGNVHVTGLTREQFRVFENGEQKKIAGFEEIHVPDHVLPLTAPPDGTFTNMHLAEPQMITVIALDMVNTPHSDQLNTRAALLRYLAENLAPNQRIALVSITTHGVGIISDVDSDPQTLMSALQRVNAGVPVGAAASSPAGRTLENENQFNASRSPTAGTVGIRLESFLRNTDTFAQQADSDRAIETTLRAFQAIAWSLSGIPGRKSLVWATGGMPLVRYSVQGSMPGYLDILYQRAMQSLNDADVALYPVDVMGMIPGGVVPAALRNPSASYNKAVPVALTGDSVRASMESVADQTGGRAFFGTNDIQGAFRSVEKDAASYYVLSYYLNSPDSKPGWRSLKVNVSASGSTVRSRTGFFVTQSTLDPELNRKQDLEFALVSPFNCTGVPLSVRWQPMPATPGKKAVGFSLHLAGDGFTIEPGDNRFNLEFAAVAYKGGENAAHAGDVVSGKVPEAAAKWKAKGLNYQNAFDLAPGAYEVRFVVRDNLSGRVGSVSAPLQVN